MQYSQVKNEPVDGIMIKEQGMFKTMQKQAMRELLDWKLLQIYQGFSEDHLENKMESFM